MNNFHQQNKHIEIDEKPFPLKIEFWKKVMKKIWAQSTQIELLMILEFNIMEWTREKRFTDIGRHL